MQLYPFLAVPIGYLLGSIPSAYLIGRLFGVDLRQEGQGHVSATAVYRRVGVFPFVIVVLMDGGKGALAMLVARALTDNLSLALAAGFFAAAGHCWSVFIRFNGGLGAVVTYAVVLTLLPLPFLAGAAAGAITFALVRRSFISTVAWLSAISAVALLSGEDPALSLYPLSFIAIQLAKRYQMRRSAEGGLYRDELYTDFRRKEGPRR